MKPPFHHTLLVVLVCLPACTAALHRDASSTDVVVTTATMGLAKTVSTTDGAGISALPVGRTGSTRTSTETETAGRASITAGAIRLEGPIDHSPAIFETFRGLGRLARIKAFPDAAGRLIKGATTLGQAALKR